MTTNSRGKEMSGCLMAPIMGLIGVGVGYGFGEHNLYAGGTNFSLSPEKYHAMTIVLGAVLGLAMGAWGGRTRRR